jgi:cell division septation protein DedD
MSNGRKATDKGKIFASAFIGMVLGIVAAGAVAWYVIEKKSTSFLNKGHKETTPLLANVPADSVPASGVAETKQHFEFYRVLTDKQDNTSRNTGSKGPSVEKSGISPSAERYFVQAGSFQNMGDAEKLKAKLAFSGFEAIIQTANIPEKGVWYRVRLGPYNSGDAGKTIVSLRQNGIIATQVQTQRQIN